MFSKRWTACIRSAFILISVAGLMSACSPSNYPFFQPQSGFHHQSSIVSQQAIPVADTLPTAVNAVPEAGAAVQKAVGSDHATGAVAQPAKLLVHQPKPRLRQELIRNPDVAQKQRSNLFSWNESTHYVEKKLSPAERKALNKNRRIPTLSWIALAGSLLPYGVLVFSLTTGFGWALAMAFSLGSILAGVASLSKISRNPEKYRGKGWAISAILLATGFMGIALLALAALSTSRVIWE